MNGKIGVWSEKALENENVEDEYAEVAIWEGKGADKGLPLGTVHPNCRGHWIRCFKPRLRKAFNEGEHPRGQPGNAGQFRKKEEESNTDNPDDYEDIQRAKYEKACSYFEQQQKRDPTHPFCTKKMNNLRDGEGNAIGHIPKGTAVIDIEVIAHGQDISWVKKGIRDVKRLVEIYRLPNGKLTTEKDWYKMKGKADFVINGTLYKDQEVHWYQCKDVGKVEFKSKRKEG
jgi:hypothetical protein